MSRPTRPRSSASPRAYVCIFVASALLGACGGGDGESESESDGEQEPAVVEAFDGDALASGNKGLACDAQAVEARVDELLAVMSLEQKAAEMHGLQIAPIDDLYYAGGDEALGIPALKMVDGPRGVRAGTATAFPVAMARGATWDPALERRVGEAMGLETLAKGGNVLLAPCMNVLRHPGWGRAQETYSEDSYHMGAMALGFIHGAQNHVIASAKHYAANSVEDTRFDVDVTIDARTLREVYLPHFRRAVVEGGVGSVMSAYNQVNGLYCDENGPLLTDILKGEWGFRGFVESDWVFGTHSTIDSARAGLDIEMPQGLYFGANLVDAVVNGHVDEDVVDAAARRILRQKLCFGLDAAPDPGPAVVESPEHRALAREVAVKSMVLLKNADAALPLDADSLASVAVVGSLAGVANLGDEGSSAVTPSAAVSPIDGLRAALEGGATQLHELPQDALGEPELATIAGADAAIVVVGLTHEDEGENLPQNDLGGDRDSLQLRPEHEQLILEVAARNPRTIVVIEAGATILVRPWADEVEAVLMAWYPGMEGGHALADLLLGAESPSGKLPVTVPRSADQLPDFDHEGLEITYDRFHGYALLDRDGAEPEYPFGHGLSYTSFAYSDLSVSPARLEGGGELTVELTIENTGARAGAEVVQLYLGAPDAGVERPTRALAGFGRVELAPGERARLRMRVLSEELAYYNVVDEDAGAGGWLVTPGQYDLWVGASARDLRLTGEFEYAE